MKNKLFDNFFPCDGATYGWKRIFLKNFLPSKDALITDQTLKNEKCDTNTEEFNYFWDIVLTSGYETISKMK